MSIRSSGRLIVGEELGKLRLVDPFDANQLKNSSYDLRIGKIFPVGEAGVEASKVDKALDSYILQPRETVWVLSEEKFQLPSTITGMAFLRTTYTRKGLFAMNTGIIDPHYTGPISSMLLNFSRERVLIKRGDSFFRILFVEHETVGNWRPVRDESKSRAQYDRELSELTANIETRNFLDIPEFDQGFYARTAISMIWGLVKQHPIWAAVAVIFVVLPLLQFWFPGWSVNIEQIRDWAYAKINGLFTSGG